MKRHRITFEIQIDVPASVPAGEAWDKYVQVSGGQHVNVGKPQVVGDEPLGDELLPYEIRRAEQLAVRKMIADVMVANKLPFVVSVGTRWDGRASRSSSVAPMDVTISFNNKSLDKLWSLVPSSGGEKWASGRREVKHNISLMIDEGQITEIPGWGQGSTGRRLGSISDPELTELIAFVRFSFEKELKMIEGQA